MKRIARKPDFPAFSEHIQWIMRSLNEEDSFEALTNYILEDFSVSLNVLQTANSALYNRSGRSITSLSHAVALLGSEAVRNIAGSLALLRHYTKADNGLRELLLLSQLTAHHAGAAADVVRYPRREEAHLCGMFRNLGEVLVAFYFHGDYTKILALLDGGRQEKTACGDVCGFAFEDLGQAVARHWNIPEQVGTCMRSVPLPGVRARTQEQVLTAIAAFSHQITNAAYRLDPQRASLTPQQVMTRFGPVLGMAAQEMRKVMADALERTKATFAAVNIPIHHLRLQHQLDAAVAGSADLAPEPAGPLPAQAEPPRSEALADLVANAEAVIGGDRSLGVGQSLLMTLEAGLRGAHFDRALFCLVDADRSHVLARLALGPHVEEIQPRFRFPLSLRGGPVAAALIRKQEVIIDDVEKVWGQSPFYTLTGAGACAILPVVIDEVPVGCLYFDRKSREPAASGAFLMDDLRRLQALAATVIRRSRGA
jgi:HD-like signal output (HDOD) protein